MLDRPNAVRSRIDSRGSVVDHRVGRPAVPQGLHHRHELFAASVAVGVAHLAGAAVILRRGREPRGDDVPGRATVADVVDRGELPREVERFGVGGRRRGDQPDPAGGPGQRRQHGDRLQPGARRLRDIAAQRQLIGEKDRIEQRRLGALRQILVVADVGQRQRRGMRMPPRRLVMAAAVDEQVEVQLPFHRTGPLRCVCLPVRDGKAGRGIGSLGPAGQFGQDACGIREIAVRSRRSLLDPVARSQRLIQVMAGLSQPCTVTRSLKQRSWVGS